MKRTYDDAIDLRETTDTDEEMSGNTEPYLSMNDMPPEDDPDEAPPRNSRARAWRWTYNNPLMSGEAFMEYLKHLTIGKQQPSYIVFQLEAGHQTATPHYQGYFYWTGKVAFNSLRAKLPCVSLRMCDAGPKANKDYCTKEDTRQAGPWEWGEMPVQGARSDLATAAQMVLEGSSLKAVALAMPQTYVQYGRGLYNLQTATATKPLIRTPAPVNWLFYGPTGTGKTFKACDRFPEAFIWNSTGQFEGYQGNPQIIYDDFCGKFSQVELGLLLRLLDRYQVRVNVKYASALLAQDVSIVTTNIHPREWYDYSGREAHYKALARRFDKVFIFSDGFESKEVEDPKDFFFTPENYGF